MTIRQALGKNGILSEKDYHAVMEDLRRLGVVEVTTRRGRYMMRTALRGRAFEAFAAVGMRVPPKMLERLGATDPPPEAAM